MRCLTAEAVGTALLVAAVAGSGIMGDRLAQGNVAIALLVSSRAAMTHLIFACVHNAGRSQMAAAFFNTLADPAKARAESAGTQPATRVHPVVADAMRETGIDLSAAAPRQLTPALAAGAEWLVTMGCAEGCPVVPGLKREEWILEDPAHLPLADVRRIRDQIRALVERFIDREHLR